MHGKIMVRGSFISMRLALEAGLPVTQGTVVVLIKEQVMLSYQMQDRAPFGFHTRHQNVSLAMCICAEQRANRLWSASLLKRANSVWDDGFLICYSVCFLDLYFKNTFSIIWTSGAIFILAKGFTFSQIVIFAVFMAFCHRLHFPVIYNGDLCALLLLICRERKHLTKKKPNPLSHTYTSWQIYKRQQAHPFVFKKQMFFSLSENSLPYFMPTLRTKLVVLLAYICPQYF